MRSFTILGNSITDLTTPELRAGIGSIVGAGKSEVTLNANVHGTHLSQQLPWLKAFRRFFERYLVGNSKFPLQVMLERIEPLYYPASDPAGGSGGC